MKSARTLRDELAHASVAWWAGLEGAIAFTAMGGILIGHGPAAAGVMFLALAAGSFALLVAAHYWRERIVAGIVEAEAEAIDRMIAALRGIAARAGDAHRATLPAYTAHDLITFGPAGGSWGSDLAGESAGRAAA